VTTPSRTQLDQTGERIRDGSATADDWAVLKAYRLSVRDAVAPLFDGVRLIASEENIPITARLKTNYSIELKLRRETIRLRQIDDIMGCRILVSSRVEQDRIAERVASLGPSKLRDRRERPSHGYRALHVILGSNGQFLEVQIRTPLQDAWAQLSEALSVKYGIEVKYGGLRGTPLRVALDSLSMSIDAAERGKPPTSDERFSFLPITEEATHDALVELRNLFL
jgi:hypothetical protein